MVSKYRNLLFVVHMKQCVSEMVQKITNIFYYLCLKYSFPIARFSDFSFFAYEVSNRLKNKITCMSRSLFNFTKKDNKNYSSLAEILSPVFFNLSRSFTLKSP